MEKSYRFRMYPNKEQERLIQKTFGCVRYVYNYFLDKRIKTYKEENKTLGAYECIKLLTDLKKEFEWLKEPDKCALQNAIKDLDIAYRLFFKKSNSGFPRFKTKKDKHQAYRSSYSNNNIVFMGNKIKLPKLGLIKIRGNLIPEGRIINATIKQNPSGRYYLSLCCKDVVIKNLPKTNKIVGIDLGLKDFAITSDGKKYNNSKYLTNGLKKLAFLERSLSRKTKDGSNYNKARIKVAKYYEKITNQRHDFLKKISTELIKNYDIICVETLKIQNLIKNKNLARTIHDTSWYYFLSQLEYKAKWYDKTIIKIDTFYPSSQLCSVCGYKNKDIKNLKIRVWKCPCCNTIHDRDINAAKNILNKGLELNEKIA